MQFTVNAKLKERITMKYKHLEFNEINRFIENCKEIDFNYIAIVLVNGDNFLGRLDKYSDSINNNQICLSHYKRALHYEFFIPFSEIAGISTSNIIQKTEEVDQKDYIENVSSLDSKILDLLIEKSKKHDFKSDISFLQLRINTKIFRPLGLTSNNTYELLHCNWEYLTRNRKTTISSIGVSVLGISISITRKGDAENSLQSKIKSFFCESPKLRVPISTDLTCQTGIIIKGYIQFIEVDNKIQTIQMDNKTYVLIYISKNKINNLKNLNVTDWCVGAISDYFNNSIMPFENLDNVEIPVSLFGDIIPARYKIGIDEINTLLKVEAIAIVPE